MNQTVMKKQQIKAGKTAYGSPPKWLENYAQRGDDSPTMKSILITTIAAVVLVGCGFIEIFSKEEFTILQGYCSVFALQISKS